MFPVAQLVKDPDNPNVMSEEQVEGLRESFRQFGYLVPVIADAKTKKVADGEHRLVVYEEFGRKEIPVVFVDFKDDAERRLLRQTMNKLRGGHDLLRDAAELKVLYDAGRLDDLTHLLAADKDSFLRILNRRFDVP